MVFLVMVMEDFILGRQLLLISKLILSNWDIIIDRKHLQIIVELLLLFRRELWVKLRRKSLILIWCLRVFALWIKIQSTQENSIANTNQSLTQGFLLLKDKPRNFLFDLIFMTVSSFERLIFINKNKLSFKIIYIIKSKIK